MKVVANGTATPPPQQKKKEDAFVYSWGLYAIGRSEEARCIGSSTFEVGVYDSLNISRVWGKNKCRHTVFKTSVLILASGIYRPEDEKDGTSIYNYNNGETPRV